MGFTSWIRGLGRLGDPRHLTEFAFSKGSQAGNHSLKGRNLLDTTFQKKIDVSLCMHTMGVLITRHKIAPLSASSFLSVGVSDAIFSDGAFSLEVTYG
ncbi:MAG: hypothetical protein ACRD4C_03110 [Candidatus Acidiferrales bacterium]